MQTRSKRLVLSVLAALLLVALAFTSVFAADETWPTEVDADFQMRKETAAADLAAPPTVREVVADETLVIERDGFFWAPIGSQFVFRSEARTTASIETEGSDAQRVIYRIAADTEWTVIGRRPGELLVRIVCAKAVVELQAAARKAQRRGDLEKQMASPIVLRMQSDGKFLGVRCSGMSTEAWGFARGLICAHQFVATEQDAVGALWQSEEQDSTGTARFNYSWQRLPKDGQRGILDKEKLDYIRVGSGEARIEMDTDGVAQAAMDQDLGFIASGTLVEHLVSQLPNMKTTIRAEQKARFQMRRHGVVTDLPRADWQSPFASLRGGEAASELGRSAMRARKVRELRDTTMPQLVQAVLAAIENGQARSLAEFELSQKVMWMVRLRPETLEALRTTLIDPNVATEARSALLAAVGAANTPAAAGLLSALMADAQNDDVARRGAAMSMFQLQKPAASSFDAVRELLAQPATELRLSSTGLLLMGAFVWRSPAGEANERMDELLAVESMAAEKGLTTSWLEALGNARNARSLAPALRFMKSHDASLRRAAVNALRHVRSTQATSALRALAAVEKDDSVVRALTEALRGRGA